MENNEMYVGLSHCSYNLLIARSIQLENGGSLTECENFIGSWWNEIGGTKLNKMKWIREHSYMTSDVLGAFLTYLPTLIRYFTT